MNWLYIITLLLGYWCHHMVETNTLANTLEQRRDELNCEPVDDCSCSMKDGSSISLWPIDDPDEPRYVKTACPTEPPTGIPVEKNVVALLLEIVLKPDS